MDDHEEKTSHVDESGHIFIHERTSRIHDTASVQSTQWQITE